jgi:8-oxo-dGTP diphosphatase
VREDVGVEVTAAEYVHSRTVEADDGTPCLNVLTRCEYDGGRARRIDPDEVAAVHRLSPSAVRRRDDAQSSLLADLERVESGRPA